MKKSLRNNLAELTKEPLKPTEERNLAIFSSKRREKLEISKTGSVLVVEKRQLDHKSTFVE
jgi:hypothetical protein